MDNVRGAIRVVGWGATSGAGRELARICPRPYKLTVVSLYGRGMEMVPVVGGEGERNDFGLCGDRLLAVDSQATDCDPIVS